MPIRFISLALCLSLGIVVRAQDGGTLVQDQELTLKFNDNLTLGTGFGVTGPEISASRYNLSLGYNRSGWGLRGGVRRTGEDFAPSDTWFGASQLLPRNSQDLSFAGYLTVIPNLRVTGVATKGESLPASGFDFTNWSTQLEYRFSPNAYGLLGFDNLNIELLGGSLMRRQWATLGFGMDMGHGSMFKLLLQYGEVSSHGSAQGDRGHVISGQISVKF